MLKLIEATAVDWKTLIPGLNEIRNHPTPYDIHAIEKLITYMDKDFIGYRDYCLRQKDSIQPDGKVPSTTLLLFDKNTFIGAYHIRHRLNDNLRQQGGHIGYEIIPSQRQRGHGKAGLKLALDWCQKTLGLKEVLLFCDAKNTASEKTLLSVMKEMGGQALPEHTVDGHVKHGFWIKTE